VAASEEEEGATPPVLGEKREHDHRRGRRWLRPLRKGDDATADSRKGRRWS
jgi:hypothetical protein